MTLSGSRLDGRYHVIESIGRGAVGEVWRAVDEWDAPMAVKVIDLAAGLGLDAEHRFLAERERLTGLNHPNVVQVRDLLIVNGAQIAIVMDLADGGDLAAMLGHETLPPVDVTAVGGQVAYGLGALHAKGFAHRALRPHNVMLHAVDGLLTAQITDFAVYRLAAAGLVVLPPESVDRNLPYLAPEVTAGRSPTPASDLYALGIMLYELSSGVRPFDGVPPGDLTHAHAHLAPGRPPGMPDLVWEQVSSLLAKDPAWRPDDAIQVAGRLTRIRERVIGLPAAPRLPAPPVPLGPSRAEAAALARMVPQPGPMPQPARMPQTPMPPAQYWSQPQPQFQPQPQPQPQPFVPGPPAPPYPQQGHPGGHWEEPAQERRSIGLWVALGALVLVAAVVVWLLLDDGGQVAGPGSPVITTSTAPTTTPGTTSPPTGQTSAPATTAAPTTSAVTTTPATPTRPPFPDGVRACTDSVGVNANTSCEFAANVATAWLATSRTGTTTVQATSPVTNQGYTMTCVAGEVTVCTGGNDAAVYIRQ